MRGSLYSPSDKAIFDALCQSKVNTSEQNSILLERGIIASKQTKREDIAHYFSQFTHGYGDYFRLSQILGKNTRREKTTASVLKNKIDTTILINASNQLENLIADDNDTHVTTNKSGDRIDIIISYHVTNFNKSEFNQVIKKEAIITIEKSGNEVHIRSPANPHAEQWKNDILSFIEEDFEGDDLIVEEISLENIDSHKLRSSFFIELISNIEGYDLYDVTDVYVFNSKTDIDIDNEDTEEDLSIGENIRIDKASLKGQGVLQSKELEDLFLKEFYISRIQWKLRKKGEIDSDIYEFEAQFSEPNNCQLFSYIAKGFYKYKSSDEYNKNRQNFTTSEESLINKDIDSAARKTLALIQNKNLE